MLRLRREECLGGLRIAHSQHLTREHLVADWLMDVTRRDTLPEACHIVIAGDTPACKPRTQASVPDKLFDSPDAIFCHPRKPTACL